MYVRIARSFPYTPRNVPRTVNGGTRPRLNYGSRLEERFWVNPVDQTRIFAGAILRWSRRVANDAVCDDDPSRVGESSLSLRSRNTVNNGSDNTRLLYAVLYGESSSLDNRRARCVLRWTRTTTLLKYRWQHL